MIYHPPTGPNGPAGARLTAPVAHGGMLQKGKVAADLMTSPRVDAHQQQGQRAPLELCIGRGPRENDGNPIWNPKNLGFETSLTCKISSVWGVR